MQAYKFPEKIKRTFSLAHEPGDRRQDPAII
jgi:hypothetical protein